MNRQEQIRKLIEDDDKLTYREIATELGITRQAVSLYCKKYSIKKESVGEHRTSQIVSLYNQGYKVKDIEKKLNISKSAVCSYLSKSGIELKKGRTSRISDEEIIAFLQTKGNPTFKEMAEHFGETVRYMQFRVYSCRNKMRCNNDNS